MQNQDNSILLAFNAGEEGAFQIIHKQFSPSLFHFTRNLVVDYQVAEDIVSETFVKLWSLRENFYDIQKIKAFLFITARNAGLDFLRKRNFQKEVLNNFQLEVVEEVQLSLGEVKSELMDSILRNLESLTERQQAIFQLRYVEDLTPGEIAKRLGLRKKTVNNHLSRIVGALKSLCTKDNFQAAVAISGFFLHNFPIQSGKS